MRPNPADATRRNIRASVKRDANLKARLERIEDTLADAWTLIARVNRLERRIEKLEHKGTR